MIVRNSIRQRSGVHHRQVRSKWLCSLMNSQQKPQRLKAINSPGVSKINMDGFVTISGVQNIDIFLLTLRFYGFDLWLSRFAETGQRQRIRNAISKMFFYIALFLINFQLAIHIITMSYHFRNLNMEFCDVMDDLRTLMLKLTTAIVVTIWHRRAREHAGMAHLVVINYLKTNSSASLRRLANRWLALMIISTVTHWAVSQYWVSSMSTDDQCKWLNIVTYLVNGPKYFFDLKDYKTDMFKKAVLRFSATADSFVYRMYGYGGRIALTCAYCVFTSLLHQCMRQMNTTLSEHLESEYDYQHYHCRRRQDNSFVDGWTSACEMKYRRTIRFNLEHFKQQFSIVYRIHHEIEQCFGHINFIWFGSLFFVSCIDIFFLAWKAGSEWFRVWSLLEFTSLTVLWLPHLFLVHKGTQISGESIKFHLNLKNLCRTNEAIRMIVHSDSYYPNVRPTIYGVVPLDIRFFLSFICTLATFSVMTIQLNPAVTPKAG